MAVLTSRVYFSHLTKQEPGSVWASGSCLAMPPETPFSWAFCSALLNVFILMLIASWLQNGCRCDCRHHAHIPGVRCEVEVLAVALPLYQESKRLFRTPQLEQCHTAVPVARKAQKVGYLADTLRFQTKWRSLTRSTQEKDADGAIHCQA